MKTKSKHLFFFMLLVIFFNRQLCSQNTYWTIGNAWAPITFNLFAPIPGQNVNWWLPNPGPGFPAPDSTPDYASNMIADAAGQPLFFIADGQVIDRTGNLIDNLHWKKYNTYSFTTTDYCFGNPVNYPNCGLVGAEFTEITGFSEACVVPHPGDCQKYFIFTAGSANDNFIARNPANNMDPLTFWPQRFYPFYACLDVSPYTTGGQPTLQQFTETSGWLSYYGTSCNGTGLSTCATTTFTNNVKDLFSQITPANQPAKSRSICYAATDLIGSGLNSHYIVFMFDGVDIYPFKVDYYGNVTYLGYSYSIANANVNADMRPELETVKMTNGNYRIAGAFRNTGGGGTVGLFMMDYIPGTGFSASSYRQLLLPQSGSTTPEIHGIELHPGGSGGTYLYFTHEITSLLPNFINYTTYGPTLSVQSIPNTPNIPSYAKSQLEISKNGNTYTLHFCNATQIGGLNVSILGGPWPFTSPVTLPTQNNLTQPYSISPTLDARYQSFLLPDNIDGRNYASNFTQTPVCCYQYSNFNIKDPIILPTGTYTVTNGSQITGTNALTNLPYSVTFSTTTTSNSDIIVPKGAVVTFNNITIKFNPNASFKVNNNGGSGVAGRVTFNTCTLTVMNECESNVFWQGMRVYGNGNLQQTTSGTTPHGWVVMNNSQVDHAVIGVEITGGGVCQANASTFIDNQLCLNMTGFTPASGPNNYTKFTRCNFLISNGTNLPAVPSYLASLYNQKQRVDFIGCMFKNNHATFNYQTIGLYSSDTYLSVTKSGSPLLNSSFENLYKGIWATTTHGSGRITSVYDAIFTRNREGMFLERSDYANVVRNEFNVLDDDGQFSSGLYIYESTLFTVTENVFKNYSLTIGNPTYTYGIVADNTNTYMYYLPGDNNVIYKNTFYNLHMGIQAKGTNRFNNPPYYDGGLKMECNTFNQTLTWCDICVSTGNGVNYHQGYNDYTPYNSFSRTVNGMDFYIHPGASTSQYIWNIPADHPLVYTGGKLFPVYSPTNSNTCGAGGQRLSNNSTGILLADYFGLQKLIGYQLTKNGVSFNSGVSNKGTNDPSILDQITELKKSIIAQFASDSSEHAVDSINYYINLFNNFQGENSRMCKSELKLGHVQKADQIAKNISDTSLVNYKRIHEILIFLNGKDIKQELVENKALYEELVQISSNQNDKSSAMLACGILSYNQPNTCSVSYVGMELSSTRQFGEIKNSDFDNLIQSIPNPFSGSTRIETTLNENETQGKITITDVTGRIVAQYNLVQGKNSVEFNPDTGVKGIFYASLQINGINKKTIMILAQ